MGEKRFFRSPVVVQNRNEHILMQDFKDEIPGYLRNAELVGLLNKLKLKNGKGFAGENIYSCYEKLIEEDFFPKKELELLQSWLDQIDILL